MKNLLCVIGTRPEAIKMAPVIHKLMNTKNIRCQVCVTAQHRNMLDQVLSLFDITPDIDLNIMRHDQSLTDITIRVMKELDNLFSIEKPDWLVVQGDTTSATAATLVAFYNQVPVAHIEAGLRSGNLKQPWPEEMNRRIIDAMAQLLFAPTTRAEKALVNEGIPASRIMVTGNTVIDALHFAINTLRKDKRLSNNLDSQFSFLDPSKKLILVTGHRRESFGEGFQRIIEALSEISARNDVELIYPVHLNQNVKKPVTEALSGNSNIHLLEPIDYLSFCYVMKRSTLILTDSGGIQEEAPSLGKPVLVMRDVTERPEAVEAGTSMLVGTNVDRIVEWTHRLLDDSNVYRTMSASHNPYGDGRASIYIVEKFLTS